MPHPYPISVSIGLVFLKAASGSGAIASVFRWRALYDQCWHFPMRLYMGALGAWRGCGLGSRGRTVSETYQSPCEAVHWEFSKRAKDGGGAAPRPGLGSWAVVPGAAEPGLTGQGWVGLSWAGLREREKRNFGLQAPRCLNWARLLVSLGGDQEFLPMCQPGSKCLSYLLF